MSWTTPLRIARREARRAKVRVALVVAMIGLPVLGLSFAASAYDTFRLTPDETATRLMGSADALVSWPSGAPVVQDPLSTGWIFAGIDENSYVPHQGTTATLLAQLPPGSRAVPMKKGFINLRTRSGLGALESVRLDLADPLARPMFPLLRGRAPGDATEAVLTPPALARLGVALGGTIATTDGARTWTVVGVAESPNALGAELVITPFDPDELAGSIDTWLVATPTPLTWTAVQRLNQHGIVALSHAVLRDPPPDNPLGSRIAAASNTKTITLGVLVAGLAVLEIVLLAGPAFAVGARRRQRDLALVAASGGTPGQVRRIVLADGVVAGLLAAVAGVALGSLVAVLANNLLEERLLHQRSGAYRFFPAAQLGVCAFAVGTGLLAALVPAWLASRQNVVAALAGRRGAARSRKRWLILGLVMVIVGGVTAAAGGWRADSTIILGGLVIGEIGLVMCTPALVGLIARLGRVLPVAPRIALRDAGRNRAAAAPAISAVMAAVAGSMALTLYIQGGHERNLSGYTPAMPIGTVLVGSTDTATPPDPQAAGLLRRRLPVTTVQPISTAYCVQACYVRAEPPPERLCPWDYRLIQREATRAEQKKARRNPKCASTGGFSSVSLPQPLIIDDGAVLPVLTGADPDDIANARAALARGELVVSNPDLIGDDGMAILVITRFIEAPGGHTPTPGPGGGGGVTTQQDEQIKIKAFLLGSGIRSGNIVLAPATASARDLQPQPAGYIAGTTRMPTTAEQDALRADLAALPDGTFVAIESGPADQRDPTALIMALAAAIITLGATGIATGLAAADGRADLSILAAVGATPRMRRTLSLSQSGVIALLGSIIGTLAGYGVAASVFFALNRSHADDWPAPVDYPIPVPWLNFLISLVVVPVIAMAGAGLLTRSRLPIERRTG